MIFDEHGERELTAWMRAAQEGDRAAYDRLLQTLTTGLRQIIRRKRPFLQPADVEDIVQDILLSLHSVRSSYDPARPFMPWLMAIVRNRMADAARRYARCAENEVDGVEFPETFSPVATKDIEADFIDEEAVALAIDALPAGQRKAFQMLKGRGLSLREASAASGLSIAALKVAVHRAVHSLRKTMREKS
jgi:RNA polymerase sigma-70 factor (ECF subfamily)